MSDIRHKELKTALMLFGTNLTAWAAKLKKPDGSIGVSRTAVTRVAQGHDEITWIEEEVDRVIEQAHKRFPQFYAHKKSESATP